MSKKNKNIKPNQYQMVVDGKCLHCGGTLAAPAAGKGKGRTRVCQSKKCGHRWYYNTEIQTSKCLTCATERAKTKK